MTQVNLNRNWTIHKSGDTHLSGRALSTPGHTLSAGYPAEVPSTVMGVLSQYGLYDDLFRGKEFADVDRTPFDDAWWYRTTFTLPPLNSTQHAFIHFDGISYYANIWLNGTQIASRDSVYGPYRRFTFDITGVAAEKNVLAVELFRAQPGDPNIGFADWNPRPPDESMGIFRPVTVAVTGAVRMSNPFIRTEVNTETLNEAWLTVSTELENLDAHPVSGKLTGYFDGNHFTYPVMLEGKEKKVITLTCEEIKALYLKNPRLWWCNHMGLPELYDMTLGFDIDNNASDSLSVTFGVRRIESYFTKEGHRGFKLNGRPVLLKSAGWTDDIFLRDTPETNELQVKYVKDMHMNMIRFENFWGTSPHVYEMCDKYGLLALIGWTCQWEWEAYYGRPCSDRYGCIQTDDEVRLIAQSFADQVRWLRNHPSIMAWMPGSDMLQLPELERLYLDFLKANDDRPYIGAAKSHVSEVSGPTGTKMAGPYEYVGPNYWYIDTQFGGAFGFNTETGIGAQLPVKESLRKFIPEAHLWPIDGYWDYHCTASTTAMNSLNELTKVMDAKYGSAKDLDDYLLKADLINYDGTRAMFEAFRAHMGKTTGIVQWMLNSAWPSLYWQLYDYYMVPTPAYYAVKKANQPVQLIYDYGKNSICVVNESTNDIRGYKAVIALYDVNSTEKMMKEIDVDLNMDNVKDIYKLDALTENLFVSLQLLDGERNHVAGNFYCISAKQDEYQWEKTNWVHTPAKTYADFRNLAGMERIGLAVEVSSGAESETMLYRVKISNPSEKVAFFTCLKLKNGKDEMVCPAFWSDNYVSLIPGEERVLTCEVPLTQIEKESLKLHLSGWNVQQREIPVVHSR